MSFLVPSFKENLRAPRPATDEAVRPRPLPTKKYAAAQAGSVHPIRSIWGKSPGSRSHFSPMTPPARPRITFRDLRRGWEAEVFREALHPLREPIALAVTRSAESQMSIRVEGTPFRIQAEFREAREGNAYFAINAAALIGGGKVGPGARICTGIACTTLATAPKAWRWLLDRYLRYGARAPETVSIGSFSFMPQDLPWVQLYSSHALELLTDEERFQCELILHGAGQIVLKRAEEAVRDSASEGRIFTPDPTEFPELRPDLWG